MKKLAIALLLSGSTVFAASASIKQETTVKYVGDMQYASFCKAVVNDDLDLFKVTLSRFVGELGTSRKSVLKRVTAQNSVQCAGHDLVEFTEKRNATKIDSFINSAKA